MRRPTATELRTLDHFRDRPCEFHRLVLGRPPFHPKQAQIADSLVRSRVVVVPGAHSVGKSWGAGSLINWWLCTRRPSKIVITSPAYAQLISVLWGAAKAAYSKAYIRPWGDSLYRADSAVIDPEHYAVALSTNEPERIQGHHGANVLVITDESSLIKDEIWSAIESLGYDRLLILGNPIRSKCRFRDYYRLAREGTPGFACVHLTAFDSPHACLVDEEVKASGRPAGLTSRTWIDNVRVMYGESSPYWKSRVLAEFPDSDELTVFPDAWLERCADESIRPKELGRSRWIACDPAGGTGRDRSGILVRDEHRVLVLESSAEWGLEACADRIAELQRLYRVPSDHVVYDATGLGLGLDGYLQQRGINAAIPFKGGESGGDEWVSMRTAAAMSASRRLNPDRADHRPFYIPPDLLAGLKPELAGLKLLPSRDDPKRQALEPKDELKARLGRSPDLGDVFCMSFVCGPDLPVLPTVVNPSEESYHDPEDDVILTSDELTLRMAGIR